MLIDKFGQQNQERSILLAWASSAILRRVAVSRR